MFNGKNVLITGGTGSFGREMTRTILERYRLRKLIIFSRDELKQSEMAQVFTGEQHPGLRYFIGDVRDQERLYEALHNVDYVIHAAALKQVPVAEYNPFEAIRTNVLGAQNVIRAAINQRVKRVMALSTDKAANPINLYGASKLCSDKLFVAGNAMSGDAGTRFSVVRYGNVVGSRGSVIPLFLKQKKGGVLRLTDERMTRFSITLRQGVDFVVSCMERMFGGEVFVPKIPSFKVVDMARAVAPNAKMEVVGIRPGEKLHEMMVPSDDARHTLEFEDRYVIQPDFPWWSSEQPLKGTDGKPCPDGFSYSSDTNDRWLGVDDLRVLVDGYRREHDL
jgi:UDP-N-acetylglucosamine 4,6-dehydratase